MDSVPIYKHVQAAIQDLEEWRVAGYKIVFTNGCFDLIHPGHINVLQQSRILGDKLIVGLNNDYSIRSIKGADRPFTKETDRAEVLGSIRYVDMVILFNENTPENLIRIIRPDIMTKGGDYQGNELPGAQYVRSYGGEVVILDYIKGYSSTRLAKSLRIE